jgi:hypothetical protein
MILGSRDGCSQPLSIATSAPENGERTATLAEPHIGRDVDTYFNLRAISRGEPNVVTGRRIIQKFDRHKIASSTERCRTKLRSRRCKSVLLAVIVSRKRHLNTHARMFALL